MRTLVIDTATEACSVALFQNETLIAHNHVVVGRGHAERLLPMIEALPDAGRAERIAVDVGPGSFTGVRIGIAAARALAFGWGADLSGYSALALIAASARVQLSGQEDIAVAITGGHGELFWQRFASDDALTALTGVASTPIAEAALLVSDVRVFGTGAQALVTARGVGETAPLHPDAACFLKLPASMAQLPPRPIYGRGADARPMG